jgi:hypothetical protein
MAKMTEVSDGFTENYGKVEVDIIISEVPRRDSYGKIIDKPMAVQEYMLLFNRENKYIIHIITIHDRNDKFNNYKIVIDNGGNYFSLRYHEYSRTYKIHDHHCKNTGTGDFPKEPNNNILPDKIIDKIKRFSIDVYTYDFNNYYKGITESLEIIKILAKDYYEIFIKYKSLNQSKLKDYDKLLEQIKNDNDTHKNNIEKLNKDIIEKDILINSLKNENISLKTENESLIKENELMKNEIDQLKKLVVTMNNFSKMF